MEKKIKTSLRKETQHGGRLPRLPLVGDEDFPFAAQISS